LPIIANYGLSIYNHYIFSQVGEPYRCKQLHIIATVLAPIWHPKMPRLSNSRFTDTFLKNLKVKDSRYEVFDALLPGFGVRVASSGTKSFVVFGREGNRRTRATLGQYPVMSLSEAREAARDALKLMKDGTYHSTRQIACYEDVLLEWYNRDQRPKKSFKQVERAMSAYVTPKLRGRDLAKTNRKDLIAIIDAVADSGALTQAARLRSYISRLYNWSTERGIIDVNPAINLPKVFVEQSRDRVLSERELILIWHATETLTPQFRVIIRLLILTGQRKSEVSGMKWSELNFKEGIWTIPTERSKNAQAHTVHLTSPVIAELMRIQRSSELVFTTTGETPVSGFSNIKKKLDMSSGVENWRLHDLRRTFATITTEKLGCSPNIVDLILNHQTGTLSKVAKIYQRGTYLNERKNTMDAWANHIVGLSEKKY